MASPIASKGSFSVKTDGRGASIHIQISEPAGVKAENLSLSTWGASFVLANLLHKIRIPPSLVRAEVRNDTREQELPVLELGAGTGLVGLSAAAIWRTGVTLTDLPSIVPGLVANIALNKPLLAKAGGSASCGSLDWSSPTALQPCTIDTAPPPASTSSSKASVILAADVIYTEDHPRLVSNTLLTWLAPGYDSMVIMCYPLRMAYIDHIREFWDLMDAGGLECREEGREEGGDEWNEVANTPYEWCVWRWK